MIRPLLGMAAAALLGAAGTAQGAESTPWDAPAFSADPAAVARAAAAVPAPAGAGVVVLLEEGRYSYDEAARLTRTYRLVYRILSPDGLEEWSALETDYAPWHEQRPVLRARVITADGAHPLDPATVAEAGADSGDRDTYSDRRSLRAPLPALAVGAVVEEEVVTTETQPFFDAGAVEQFYFGKGVPVQRTRLSIDAPSSLPLHTITVLLPEVAESRQEEGGRRQLVFETGRLAPLPAREASLPPDVPRWPRVAFSTGASWAEVARSYAQVVDRQIAAGVPAAMRVTGGDRAQQIARWTARVRDLRYTAVEFGEASIVPRTPAETLQRHYGDCKDKAALLVAGLRSAGIDAAVALLSSGSGPDVDPALPGMGAFNHAIVHVPGSPDLWIDPTSPYARPGELPLPDQGRLALVARAGTTALVRIPEPRAEDNVSLEEREIVLAELGPARVREVSTYRGSFERSTRDAYAHQEREKLEENLLGYVKDEYLAKGLSRFDFSDPADLGGPFRITVEATDAERGNTDGRSAVVGIFPGGLADDLPEALRADPPKDGKDPERVADFFLSAPLTAEYRYRIVPPPGFRPRPLPPGGTTELGPARLFTEWTAAADGTVTGTLRLVAPRERLDPRAFAGMRAAVRALRAAPAVRVEFEQVGEAALAEGRVADALAEFRKLAALHPREALHHTQIALALLGAGLGEAARTEARLAVEREKDSALAQRRLGWVLQHDLVGRRMHRGASLAEAIAAYRRAKELAPADTTARTALAWLLEFDPQLQRFGPGAPLEEAIAEFEALARDGTRFSDLPLCLAYAGHPERVRAAARELTAEDGRDGMLLLGTVLEQGREAGLGEARAIGSLDARRTALDAAADALIRLRRYADAAALLREASLGATNAADYTRRADLLARTRRHEELDLSGPDPGSVVRRFLVADLTGTADETLAFFTRGVRDAARLEVQHGATDSIAVARERLQRMVRKADLPADVLVDLGLATAEITVDGDPAWGYRARMRSLSPSGERVELLFMVPEDGVLKLLVSGETIPVLGLEVLRRLDQGEPEAARHWLDWAREEVTLGSGDDRAADLPFARLWTIGRTAGPDAMRVAAAALLAQGGDPPRAVQILTAARPLARTAGEQEDIDLALAWAYASQRQDPQLLEALDRLDQAQPRSASLFTTRRDALARLDRLAELRAAAGRRLQLMPEDPVALRALRLAAEREGKLEEVPAVCQRLVASGRALALDHNECAWAALVAGHVDQAAVDMARKAVDLTQRNQWSYLHTLASLYAEIGRGAEARDTILRGMEAAGLEEPQPEDWYVFGRMAEGWGLTDAAASAYRRVGTSRDPRDVVSTAALAQKRLAALAPASRPKAGAPRS